MPVETERKFLVSDERWQENASGTRYRQGYLCTDPERSVRIRTDGGRAFITVKGALQGASRLEFEYPLPLAEAEEMLQELCVRPLIEKTRYRVEHAGKVWEIDVFHGDNDGLVVAEIELESEDEVLDLPDWIGIEVTADPRYYNLSLTGCPYCDWPDRD